MAFFPEENPFRTAFRLVLSWLKVWGGRIAQAGSSPRRQPRPRQWDPEALPDITLQPVEMARTRPPPPPPLPPPPFDEAVLSWMRLWHRRMAHSSLEVLLTMGKGAPVWMETPLNLPEADRLAPYRDNLDCEVCAELYGTSGGPRSKPSKLRQSIRKSFLTRRSMHKAARKKPTIVPRRETLVYDRYNGGMI
ncbi:hypothetical protein MCOR25_009156 [Pyricularia grisea]|nr:hypothetical protein MCOR25_009156 [Pyricularia grisea]